MTDQTKALLPVTQDRLVYIRWSDDGQHIRKWAREPFEGATVFANAGNGAPLGPFDADDHYPVAQLPFALRSIAENIHVECADHVLEDMVRIVTDAANVIEARISHSLPGDAGEGEPYPGCYADLQQRRVTTLAKLGLMLSEMGKGDAAKDELYAEVLMALGIEDAEDTDIALEEVRDHPGDDCLISAGEHFPGVNCPDCGGRIATACPHCGAQPDPAALTPSPCPGDGMRDAVNKLLHDAEHYILDLEPAVAHMSAGRKIDRKSALAAISRVRLGVAALTPSALSGEDNHQFVSNPLIPFSSCQICLAPEDAHVASGDAGEGDVIANIAADLAAGLTESQQP